MIIDAPPYNYLQENLYNSGFSPSTIHGNSVLANYYAGKLFQKAISPFKFKLPETWPEQYFLYTIYTCGFGCVFNAGKFGTAFNDCTLYGFNLYYQPTNAVVTNPVLEREFPDKSFDMEIGRDCEIVLLQPTYKGILETVCYYADLLATYSSTLVQTLINSRLAYVFAADNKAGAETLKKTHDKIVSGDPAVFLDSKIFDSQGNLRMELFNRDIKASYIVSDLLSDMRRTEEKFLTDIGIPNANTDKRERLISKEVDANNFETRSMCEVWMDCLKASFEKINAMFGLSLDVEWRNMTVSEVNNNAAGRDNQPASAL